MKIALLDFSGLFRKHWHATEHEEMGEAVRRTVAEATQRLAGFDHAAICVDRPPYKRSEIDPNYKAHREKAPAVMYEQAEECLRILDADGCHIVGADGYEADDIIAGLINTPHPDIDRRVIFSSDKDLLQLVHDGTHVTCVSLATGTEFDSAAVFDKFGVLPEHISDWLALAGDKSDGIAGVKGCGPKTAAKWINEFDGIEGVLMNAEKLGRFAEQVEGGKDAIARDWKLAQLMYDAPVKLETIMQPKERKEPESMEPETEMATEQPQKQTQAVAVRQRVEIGPEGWDKALEPRDPTQAWNLAKALFQARMFGDFPNAESILAIIMTGRSFGMDAVSSLRGFHPIKGKASPSSQLLIGLVKRHPACEYFRLVSSDAKSATWETKRADEPEPTTMSYTMADASSANLANLDQWKKRPQTMLRWRAGVELARVVYPDVVSGLYTIEESREI